MKRKKTGDALPTVIAATVIATLSVVAAAASIAYMLHDRYCRLKAFDPCCDGCDTGYMPIVPDDDELEF